MSSCRSNPTSWLLLKTPTSSLFEYCSRDSNHQQKRSELFVHRWLPNSPPHERLLLSNTALLLDGLSSPFWWIPYLITQFEHNSHLFNAVHNDLFIAPSKPIAIPESNKSSIFKLLNAITLAGGFDRAYHLNAASISITDFRSFRFEVLKMEMGFDFLRMVFKRSGFSWSFRFSQRNFPFCFGYER